MTWIIEKPILLLQSFWRSRLSIVTIFILLWILFYILFDLPIAFVKWKTELIHSSEIIKTYSLSDNSFIFENNKYKIFEINKPTCNGNSCSIRLREDDRIILNKLYPERSRLVSEILLSVLVLLVIILIITWNIIWRVIQKIQIKRIQDYLNNGEVRSAIVVDIIKHRYGKGRYCYRYICKDIQTESLIKSNLYHNNVVPIWSKVNVYSYNIKYWEKIYVDMNGILQPNTEWERNVYKVYKEEKLSDSREKYTHFTSGEHYKIWKNFWAILFILLSLFIGTPFIIVSPILAVIIIILLNIPTAIIIKSLLDKRKEEEIISKWTHTIWVIKQINKHWFRSQPFGYIPEWEPLESQFKPIEKRRDMKNLPYGYQYSFLIEVWWRVIESKVFKTLFPTKAKIWAKISVYSTDNQIKNYVIDINSIDVIN